MIRRALHNLPESLDETYDRILQSITHGRQEFAQHLFQCLAVSFRPLRVEELADILAIEFEAEAAPQYHMDYRVENPEEEVLSICSCLITIVDMDGSRVVRFSHFSVKEYLISQRLADSGKGLSEYRILSYSAHTILAQASLSVLLALNDQVNKDSMKNYPLAIYAARYWVDHAQVNDISSRVKDAMDRLFNPDEPHFATWVWIHDIDYSFRETMFTERPSSPTATPLYYATLCGFHDLVEHLIFTRPGDVNARGGCHDTPLHVAVIKGNVNIVRLLLGHGADMATLNNEDFGPLHEASRRGRLDVIGLLLDHRADVDSRNLLGRTPLFIASQEGELEVARVLLQRGATVNSYDNNGHRPLTTASKCGHLDLVRLLLQNGATVDQASLVFASENGHLDVVHLLLQNGATATGVPHCMHRNALALASQNGHLDVVHLLLQNGTAVDVHCSGGWTPLMLASQSGHLDVVRLLLGNDATVDFCQKDGWTSLMFASQNGHVDVVRLLLQRSASVECGHHNIQVSSSGSSPRLFISCMAVQNDRHADSNSHGGCPGSALHLASTSGHTAIVELLIQYGADVNSQNYNQETPLYLASRHGQLETTHLLLASGSEVSSRDSKNFTALHRAALSGHLDVVTLLLESGADINARNADDATPLDLASAFGRSDVARLLAEHMGVTGSQIPTDVTHLHTTPLNIRPQVAEPPIGPGEATNSSDEETTLHAASGAGAAETVRSLLLGGADVNERDAIHRTPVFYASQSGMVEVAELLIKHGADVNSQDGTGRAPLHLASREGHLDVVRLLLDHGAGVDAVMQDHWTALHFASKFGYLEIVKALLGQGANVGMKNDSGRTPYQVASRYGHRRIMQLLSEYGAHGM